MLENRLFIAMSEAYWSIFFVNGKHLDFESFISRFWIQYTIFTIQVLSLKAFCNFAFSSQANAFYNAAETEYNDSDGEEFFTMK